MKKNQSNSRGLLKSSLQHQMFKNQSSSSVRSHGSKDISDLDPLDSPYKNSLSEIKQISLKNDDDDFTTPQPVKKVAKVVKSKVVPRKACAKKSKTKSNNSVQKHTLDNFYYSDINPDHLQMAIALSKSTYSDENPDESNEQEQDFSTFLADKIPKGRTVLEMYGFRVNTKTKLSSELRANHREDQKKRKNSKFRFVTPVLHTRTNTERNSLISTKISLIISQQNPTLLGFGNVCHGMLNSDALQKYHCKENHIMNINMTDNKDMEKLCFYCTSLKLLPNRSAYGCLLKKWDEIPGRERSPERQLENFSIAAREVESNDNNLIEVCADRESCTSPDLFDSDYESFSPRTQTNNNENSSVAMKRPSLLQGTVCEEEKSTIFCNDNGIEHFESYGRDFDILSEDALSSRNSEERDLLEALQDVKPLDIKQSPSSEDWSSNKSFSEHSMRIEENVDIEKVENFHTNSGNLFQEALRSDEPSGLRESSSDDICSPMITTKQHDTIIDGENTRIDCFKKITEAILGEEKDVPSLRKSKAMNSVQQLCQSEMLENLDNIDNQKLSSDDDTFDLTQNSPEPEQTVFISNQSKETFTSRDSLEYNCTKSLNVTDYISQMLNSQPDDDLNESLTQGSCSEETIIISDEELNYSSINSKEQKNKDDFYNLSDNDEICHNRTRIDENEIDCIHLDLRNKYKISQDTRSDEDLSPHANTQESEADPVVDFVTPQKSVENITVFTSHRECSSDNQTNNTPTNNLIIKTKDITPMINYDLMDTPNIRKELDKFGLKPLKRPRGIKLLKYIYESTHPLVTSEDISSSDQEEELRATKRKKTSDLSVNYILSESVEDLIFERKISSKAASCRIPLQIAWYNFVSANPQLHEDILLYEPIRLEEVHAMLKKQSGCKFHIEDLVTFLDKKCITFRTTQSQSGRMRK